MVGQREVYARLEIAVDAAAKRGEPLGHILFDGPPGLGKTTFAMCIPRDLGVGFQIASGAALTAPKDIVPYLTNAEERSVLFIDEIHRLPKAVEEFLYPAMEDFRIDLTLGEGVNARTINMPLKPFTLIGATTRTGLLSAPLRDRFQMREHLDFYTVEELSEIVRRNAREAAGGDRRRRPRWRLPAAAAARPGWRTTGSAGSAITPRAGPTAGLRLPVAGDALEMQGIDALGLDPQDRKYLETIARVFGGGPVGVEAVAHTMNLFAGHADRRGRAIPAAQRAGGAHAPRPQDDRRGVRAPGPHPGPGIEPGRPRKAVPVKGRNANGCQRPRVNP